ncbi:Myb-like, SWIRM and MPN domains 1 [Gonapodya sp. JEL0774]|nr:Myb-like, SWIRM and MPN domains 1 [Gonapodya sp. JEL0774]
MADEEVDIDELDGEEPVVSATAHFPARLAPIRSAPPVSSSIVPVALSPPPPLVENLLQSTDLLDPHTDPTTLALIQSILEEDVAGERRPTGTRVPVFRDPNGAKGLGLRDNMGSTLSNSAGHAVNPNRDADLEAAQRAQLAEWGLLDDTVSDVGSSSQMLARGHQNIGSRKPRPKPRQPKAKAKADISTLLASTSPSAPTTAATSHTAKRPRTTAPAPSKRSSSSASAVGAIKPSTRPMIVSKETVRLVHAETEDTLEDLDVDLDDEVSHHTRTMPTNATTLHLVNIVTVSTSMAMGDSADNARTEPEVAVLPADPIVSAAVSIPSSRTAQSRIDAAMSLVGAAAHGLQVASEPNPPRSLEIVSPTCAKTLADPPPPRANSQSPNDFTGLIPDAMDVDAIGPRPLPVPSTPKRAINLAEPPPTSAELAPANDIESTILNQNGGIEPSLHRTDIVSGSARSEDTLPLRVENTVLVKSEEQDGGPSTKGVGDVEDEPDDLWDTPIHPTLIHPLEALHNPEFFLPPRSLKQAHKTPERYVRIRNHMLTLWAGNVAEWEANTKRALEGKGGRMKVGKGPWYLTKTRCRRGLKEGDVHALSRVHTFLERCGAINRGASKIGEGSVTKERKEERKRKRMKRESEGNGDDAIFDASETGTRATRYPARNRAPSTFYVHASEEPLSDSDSASTAASHSSGHLSDEDQRQLMLANARYFAPGEVEAALERFERRKRKKRKGMKVGERKRWKVDWSSLGRKGYGEEDLGLMDVSSYGRNAPFKLTVDVGVKSLGLIAGHFLPTSCPPSIHLRLARPCQALSSSPVHCEIDPLSELAARKSFSERGLAVVGWYHSHPTFEAKPSGRDVATQGGYQALFRRSSCIEASSEVGGVKAGSRDVEPFVGVIVSPYGGHGAGSKWGVFHVGLDQWLPGGNGRVPYGMSWEVVGEGFEETEHAQFRDANNGDASARVVHATWEEVKRQIEGVVEEAKKDPHHVPLSHPFRPSDPDSPTRLRKLLDSLRADMIGLREGLVEEVVGWVEAKLTGFGEGLDVEKAEEGAGELR